MIDDSKQAKRVVFMLKKLQNGYRLTALEFMELINHEFEPVTLRTVQRDLRVLEECETAVDYIPEGRAQRYYIPRTMRRGSAMRIESNDILSFHILKAHLKTFKGTMIEEHTNHLSNQLDEIFPQDVFEKESLYWNKNIGQFDYTDYDKIIRQVIHYASKHEWVEVTYCGLDNTEPVVLKGVLDSIFTYYGYLYVAAYITKNKKYVALALHRIEKIIKIDPMNIKIPKFNFNEFASTRFGVFEAEPEKVVLRINKKYAHYFLNRFWHSSQRFARDINNHLLLTLNVPVVPDFISWVLSWGSLITVLKPLSLKSTIVNKASEVIENYGKRKVKEDYEIFTRKTVANPKFSDSVRVLSPTAKSKRGRKPKRSKD